VIKIKYFARLSESLGHKSEELACTDQIQTVQDVINQLVERGEVWSSEFSGENKNLLAVNQEMSERNVTVKDGDEVAFFPPVTGG